MKHIAVDGFGGDFAPEEIGKGCIQALSEMDDISILITGDKTKLSAFFDAQHYDQTRLQIVDAREVIHSEEEPMKAIRAKKDSSLVRALELVAKKQAQVMISSGSTGAVLGGATTIVKRIKGVKRPGLAPFLPTVAGQPVMLIDCGANVDCKPVYLQQFAVMGSLYCQSVLGMQSPRVGLINNGTEAGKGNELTRAVYPMLKEAPINFVGNCEAREVLSGDFDVVVADGFDGNIVLKTTEGVAMTIMKILKRELMSDMRSKIGATLAKGALQRMKNQFDYEAYGGALLLGIDGGIIKTHGNAKAVTICSAIRQGRQFIEGAVVEKIRESMLENEPNDAV